MDCKENCLMQSRVEALEKDAQNNATAHLHFYDKFEAVLRSQAVTEERYNSIMTSVGKIENKIEELGGKPGKRWDTVITALIGAAVGLLVGLLSKGM